MKFEHTSVLLNETIENLKIKPDGIYVDGTLGGGGHAEQICSRLSEEGTLLGIDKDEDALKAASERLERWKCKKIYVKGSFSEIGEILKSKAIPHIDGAVLDIGVSSFQLDNAKRGFSYMQNAPLDMRMDMQGGFSAYDVINDYSKDQLREVIRKYGEERWATRIASFIVEARKDGPIRTTGELVDIVKSAIPASARRDGPHPAKRTFQAIRIEVNNELGELEEAIDSFIDALGSGGRLCIITFHSLEDRIVKEKFRKRLNPCTCPKNLPCVCGKVADVKKVTGKPIIPSAEELDNNHRSRSAKLRVIEKL